jgi:hypothetical protein
VRREIVAGGGEASVCEASFVEGLTDGAVEALFNTAREADYAELARELRRVQQAHARRKHPRPGREGAEAALSRLRKRLGEVAALDFFGASGRDTVEGLLASLDATLRPPDRPPARSARDTGEVRGRTWVTRSGVHVDRIASAWLIRRFIDPEARFKFVVGHRYAPEAGEIRFDMFEAEHTHEGELCTFEVLVQRFGLDDRALGPIGEIVHDVDLKDAKFSRPEALGIDRLIAGIAMRHADDEARLRDGEAVFDGLHEYFKRKRPGAK